MQRIAAAIVIALGTLISAATPAVADPAEPTNYRSIITGIDPLPTGLAIEVVGGDAFLSLVVDAGHTVLVPGYFGEPYLRADPDGAIYLNTRSPARYINQDRYGTSAVPDNVDPDATPTWEQVGSDGRFAWHDHRIHWMSQQMPPSVSGDSTELVFPWMVLILVDGVETEITGELYWIPSENPAGPIVLGLVGLLPLATWRRGRITHLAVSAGVVGALIIVVATAQFAATPDLDRGPPLAVAFPIITVAAAFGALWRRSQGPRTWGLLGIAGLALVWWAWGIASALTAPVLPSALPEVLERGGVALAIWFGIGLTLIAGYETTRNSRQVTTGGT